jgi:hypothetical protein
MSEQETDQVLEEVPTMRKIADIPDEELQEQIQKWLADPKTRQQFLRSQNHYIGAIDKLMGKWSTQPKKEKISMPAPRDYAKSHTKGNEFVLDDGAEYKVTDRGNWVKTKEGRKGKQK